MVIKVNFPGSYYSPNRKAWEKHQLLLNGSHKQEKNKNKNEKQKKIVQDIRKKK